MRNTNYENILFSCYVGLEVTIEMIFLININDN